MAADLAERSDAVAAKLDAGDPCGALADAEDLRQRALAAIKDGRVPPPYRGELSAAVSTLAAGITCTVATPQPPPAPAGDEEGDAEEDDEDDDEGEKGEKKGKGKGKGKGRKGGDD